MNFAQYTLTRQRRIHYGTLTIPKLRQFGPVIDRLDGSREVLTRAVAAQLLKMYRFNADGDRRRFLDGR